jgi:hypothetical protein
VSVQDILNGFVAASNRFIEAKNKKYPFLKLVSLEHTRIENDSVNLLEYIVKNYNFDSRACIRSFIPLQDTTYYQQRGDKLIAFAEDLRYNFTYVYSLRIGNVYCYDDERELVWSCAQNLHSFIRAMTNITDIETKKTLGEKIPQEQIEKALNICLQNVGDIKSNRDCWSSLLEIAPSADDVNWSGNGG